MRPLLPESRKMAKRCEEQQQSGVRRERGQKTAWKRGKNILLLRSSSARRLLLFGFGDAESLCGVFFCLVGWFLYFSSVLSCLSANKGSAVRTRQWQRELPSVYIAVGFGENNDEKWGGGSRNGFGGSGGRQRGLKAASFSPIRCDVWGWGFFRGGRVVEATPKRSHSTPPPPPSSPYGTEAAVIASSPLNGPAARWGDAVWIRFAMLQGGILMPLVGLQRLSLLRPYGRITATPSSRHGKGRFGPRRWGGGGVGSPFGGGSHPKLRVAGCNEQLNPNGCFHPFAFGDGAGCGVPPPALRYGSALLLSLPPSPLSFALWPPLPIPSRRPSSAG